MYAITGAFGQTGQALSQALLDLGKPVRMIVRRDDHQAKLWRTKGAEIVVADLCNPTELTRAFENVQAAYLMNPPAYFVADLFAQAHLVHANLIAAANAASVPYAVALSSVGAQHSTGTGNILTTYDFENQLSNFTGELTILRAANFMENWAWSLSPVIEKSILPSMFLPKGRALPMVSALDIGRTAASLIVANSGTRRIVELHGPQDYSPADAARAFSQQLGRPIQPVEDNYVDWSTSMINSGFPMTTVNAFVEMFAGFNSGLIAFEGTHETRRGQTSLQDALSALLKSAAHH
nr:NmrA family NAD(P)-binding protein [Rhodoferax sp.]